MPVRMTPLEPPAADAIVVGDSRRAFALAQSLTVQPRMSHQARGLWGHTGTSRAGLDLTVQSTGIGGPSAVAVIGDLVAAGVSTVVRLGTCVSLSKELKPGEVLLVERAIAADGAGRALAGQAAGPETVSGPVAVRPDRELFKSLIGLGRPPFPATTWSPGWIPGRQPSTARPSGPRWPATSRPPRPWRSPGGWVSGGPHS